MGLAEGDGCVVHNREIIDNMRAEGYDLVKALQTFTKELQESAAGLGSFRGGESQYPGRFITLVGETLVQDHPLSFGVDTDVNATGTGCWRRDGD